MVNCNFIEKWFDEDFDIKYVCENVVFGVLSVYVELNKCELFFKNVFCV